MMEMEWCDRVFTLETRISNADAEYFKHFSPKFAKMCRRIWQDLKHGVNTDAKYVSAMMKQYGFMKRTVNSALRQMKGRMSALKELQKVQIQDARNKVSSLDGKINDLSAEIDVLKRKLKQHPNDKDMLGKYNNKKAKLYSLQDKKNRYVIKIRNYEDALVNTLELCFGSKKFFSKQYNLKDNGYKTHEKWLNDFRKLRDRQVYYVGSNDETCGNQQFQMNYNESTKKFYLQIRKENSWCNDIKDKYILIEANFKYKPDLLVQMLKEGSAMSYIVTCKDGKWYVDVSFHCMCHINTNKNNGCIGMDFNNGFIAVAETDDYGNLIGVKDILLKYHGTGNKAKSEMSEVISKIVRYTKCKGKALCIEDLSFSKKKSICIRRGKKQYNQMIHMLDYSRYMKDCEDYTKTHGVRLYEVNPAYTSQIGKSKYVGKKKLTIHDSAAYVIARKCQGYIDKKAA